jgi:hippurate hydrolase
VQAGDTATTNVVPSEARFGATVRTFSDVNFKQIRVALDELMHSTAKAHGIEVEVEFTPSSHVVNNDKAAVARAEKLITETFGADGYVNLPAPIAGGEDFASILREVPGAFIFLGAMPPDLNEETAEVNHSDKARFDDSVVGVGAALLAALAFDVLGE